MPYYPVDKYTCTLDLAMEIREGWNSNNVIFDWGSSADKYTTTAEWESKEYDFWARPIANDPPVTLDDGGFRPFGTHIAQGVTGYRYPVYNNKVGFHGVYHRFDVELIPYTRDGISYDNSPYTPNFATGFGIMGIDNFPMPVCTPEASYSISYNRQGNVIREFDSGENTEARNFSMKWKNLCSEDLRIFLIKLITVYRGMLFPIDFGESLPRLAPWLPRDGEPLTGVYNLRLASSQVVYSCKGGLWDLEIKVLKWES